MNFIIKFIIAITVVISSISFANAQIEYVPGSFSGIADKNIAGTSDDIGVHNMTDRLIDNWREDADGEDTNGLLVLFFENLSPEDIKLVGVSRLSNNFLPSYVDPEIHMMNGRPAKWIYIPSAKDAFDIDITHPRLGTARIPGAIIEKHKIYGATVRAKGLVNISINTEPTGAKIYFDSQEAGRTPATIKDVTMGKHFLVIESPNSSVAEGMAKSIDVSTTSTGFFFDLRKKKNVTFSANPSSSTLTIMRDGKKVTSGVGTFKVPNLEYGSYKIIGQIGGDTNETMIEIGDKTPEIISIDVVPSRSISFGATQNNQPVIGADINLDGVFIGKTPYTRSVNYGKYNVDMSYAGYHKRGKLNVSRDGQSEINLKLPNRHRYRNNLFDMDYNRREWGISASYINRYYSFKVNGQSEVYNFWSESKHDNGIELGIAWQPYFGYGQGMNLGLYWHGFFSSIEESGEKCHLQEHSLYMPIQYQFRLPLDEDFSIFVNGGVGMSLGVYNSLQWEGEDEIDLGYGYNDTYDFYFPKAFDMGWLIGGGIQIHSLQIEAKYYRGFLDNSHMYSTDGEDKVSFKSRMWSVGLSLMF